MNHVIADGTSFWHFWNTWSYIHKQHSIPSKLPLLERWFPKGYGPRITLPYTHSDEFIRRYESPELRERIFHFSSDSMLKLKTKANIEVNETDKEISSFQAFSALLWRSVTRARRLTNDQKTLCSIDVGLRQRLEPQFPREYFGNLIWAFNVAAKTEELLEKDLGWAAELLQKRVSELNDRTVRGVFEAWIKSPIVHQIDKFLHPNNVTIASSVRFDIFGNDFGLGKPVAIRSGYGNKFPGKATVYPGKEGGRSIDLEICLPPDKMMALELDEEFISFVAEI